MKPYRHASASASPAASPIKDTRTLRLAIIGAGNMGEALLRGFIKSGVFKAENITITGKREVPLQALAAQYEVRHTLDNAQAAKHADIVLFAVKPQILDQVAQEIAPAIPHDALIISIAAGVSTRMIEILLHPHCRVFRTMPNSPCLVGTGAIAISAGKHATAEDAAIVRHIFGSVGWVTEVDESLIDAVTGLSGSGPAYVFMIIEALADAGVKVGLPRYTAQALAAQTVLGSSQLLIETGEHPGVLKDQVTSPGGTAIQGLHTLEEGGLRTTLINAVVAATERARELGIQLEKAYRS